MTISRVGFIVGEVVFLAIVQSYGGPPWTLVAVVAFIALAFTRPWAATLGLVVPGLLWLALFRATGNRELFFPYAMHLAAVAAFRTGDRGATWSLLGGGIVVGVFLVIRVFQDATTRVLAVELAVAAAILTAAVALRACCPRRVTIDAAIIAASALLAYAGLAL
ncbi:MAG: hypothetical protein WD060_05585 [Pirellulales bacterium]